MRYGEDIKDVRKRPFATQILKGAESESPNISSPPQKKTSLSLSLSLYLSLSISLSLSLPPQGLDIGGGSVIEIKLAHFTSSSLAATFSVQCFTVTSRRVNTPSTQFTSASWALTDSLLKLTASAAVQSGTTILVQIPTSAGLRLPAGGSQSGSSEITVRVQSEATSGMLAAPVASSPASTALFSDLALSFAAGTRTSFPAEMTLTIRSTKPGGFAQSDEITLGLPRFARNTSLPSTTTINTTVPAGSIGSVVWTQGEGRGIVKLTLAQNVNANTMLSITLPVGYGAIVPADGVRSNDPAFTVALNHQSAGSVLETSIPIVSPIGAVIGSPSLTFDNPISSQSTTITVNSTLAIPLGPGDTVSLQLSKFTGTSTSSFSCVSLPEASYFPKAAWTLSSELLTLTVGTQYSVPAGQWFHVTIPSSVGIKMPAAGIPVPSTCASARVGCPILLSASAAAGPIVDSPVYNLNPVGENPQKLKHQTFISQALNLD